MDANNSASSRVRINRKKPQPKWNCSLEAHSIYEICFVFSPTVAVMRSLTKKEIGSLSISKSLVRRTYPPQHFSIQVLQGPDPKTAKISKSLCWLNGLNDLLLRAQEWEICCSFYWFTHSVFPFPRSTYALSWKLLPCADKQGSSQSAHSQYHWGKLFVGN